MYTKSYKVFVASLLAFIVLILGIPFVPGLDGELVMRLIMLVTAWYMAALTVYVWHTEQVYWYNGTTFEEAEAAGSERRKIFAWKHAKVFGALAGMLTVFSGLMHLLGLSAWIDFVVSMAGLIAAAFRTVTFKI